MSNENQKVPNHGAQHGRKIRAVVAMSGGVDSSVAAALLVNQGYDVIGMMLRLWSEPGQASTNRCCTPDAMGLARRVANQLGIPFYTIDAQEQFRNTVVKELIDGYTNYVTPNPCLVCNKVVRWHFLLRHALAIGADFLATGHYARLRRSGTSRIQLLRAVDSQKDQSYVLHVLDQDQLEHALFPLGDYYKPQVRQLARELNLPVAERSESQDLCFLADSNYRQFLSRYAPQANRPGPIYNRHGDRLGDHQGLAFYTIGQRKGLGLSSNVPLYVYDKDQAREALIVGTLDELGRSTLISQNVSWVSIDPPESPIHVQAKIRYRAQDVQATVSPRGDSSVLVTFDQPMRDITPGQAVVFYDGDVCLGGGIIRLETERNDVR